MLTSRPSLEFLEIEHKFVVDDTFSFAALRVTLLALHPERVTEVRTSDTYYLLDHQQGVVFRHRHDEGRQELTLKSRSAVAADTEARLEVNLRLDPAAGNQRRAVAELLRPFGVGFEGSITKQVHVFYFPDCEIVYYLAEAGGREVRCVEFEARGRIDLAAAREVLSRYEAITGFAGRERSRRSLFDLLLGPDLPAAG